MMPLDISNTRAGRRRIRRGRLPSVQQGQGHGETTYVPNVTKSVRQAQRKALDEKVTKSIIDRLRGA